MSRGGMSPFATPKAYLDNQCTYPPDPEKGRDSGLRVLKSTVRCGAYYAACQSYDADGPRETFAIICLVKWNPGARSGEEFGKWAHSRFDLEDGVCDLAAFYKTFGHGLHPEKKRIAWVVKFVIAVMEVTENWDYTVRPRRPGASLRLASLCRRYGQQPVIFVARRLASAGLRA